MKRLAGIVLVISFIMFVIGVVQPVITQVFGTSDATEQLQYMEASPDQWQFGNLMMGIGGAIAAIGVVIFAVALKQEDEDSQIILATYASAVLIVIGAIIWVFVCYSRITLPAIEVAGNQNIYGWTEVVFTLSFIIGIVLLGYTSIQKYSKWVGFIVGIIVIVYDVGMSLMTFISFGTVPPAIHYLPIAILGLMLIVKGGEQSRQNLMSHSPELQSQS